MRHFIPVAVLALAVPAVAQMPTTPPGGPYVKRVVAGTYKADPAHTQVLWQVNHLGFSLFDGAFADVIGTLTIDPAKLAATKVEVEVPIARLTTTSAKLNDHLWTPDFFDAAKYPTASFKSTGVVVKGATARISGNLTLHGVTRPVVLDARFVGAGIGVMTKAPSVGFRASTTIKRSDFGLGYGVPMVSDLVKLEINAAFDKTS